ncbi:MAG TPA: hypothetical protein VFK13_07600 [Gemmatimonadaceae bacterium]|nr:hypothetical protein [Gemmatimonadaceae bacterium]
MTARPSVVRARAALCAALLLALAAACTAPQREVISRYTSPDGKVDAIVAASTVGTPPTVAYSLYLAPHGADVPGPTSAMLIADHVDSLRVRWSEPKRLEIGYDSARIFRFTNFWQAKEVDSYRYVVELRLAPTSAQWSLTARDRAGGRP